MKNKIVLSIFISVSILKLQKAVGGLKVKEQDHK
ncbi:hypothetical protein Desaci_0913 [Desulfosporosinus acidiphilus SJ4]|uniref:Uncharacterized protein n=1 Tax=Desulfosporosinus acidiphilus (strain DSM 22704 / JCM 16185 / SJ4) TaxID=646529 RepID=I4D2D5_DESAJ|nr:hypothetical protein Desaci_0913 [Desulfosporosinus acidiphilus SJ4]